LFKRNYSFEKHKKDQAKKQKAEEKRQKKMERYAANRDEKPDTDPNSSAEESPPE
jgi:hypothetical protein